VVGVDRCVFPVLHIITYCDKEWSEALRSAVTQTRNEVGNLFPTWSAHKEVFVMYGWHLEQRCPGGDKKPQALLWVGICAACVNKITIYVIPNLLNSCAISTVHICHKCGHVPHFRHPCFRGSWVGSIPPQNN